MSFVEIANRDGITPPAVRHRVLRVAAPGLPATPYRQHPGGAGPPRLCPGRTPKPAAGPRGSWATTPSGNPSGNSRHGIEVVPPAAAGSRGGVVTFGERPSEWWQWCGGGGPGPSRDAAPARRSAWADPTPRGDPRGRHHPDQRTVTAQALDWPPSPPPGPHASAERAEAETRASHHDRQTRPVHPRLLPAAHPGRRHHRRQTAGRHRHPRRRNGRRGQPHHRHLRQPAHDHPVRHGRRDRLRPGLARRRPPVGLRRPPARDPGRPRTGQHRPGAQRPSTRLRRAQGPGTTPPPAPRSSGSGH